MTQTPTQVPEPEVRPFRMIKPVLIVALVVACGFGVVASATYLGGKVAGGLTASDEPVVDVPAGQPVTVEIPEGANAQEIGDILAEAGVVRTSKQFQSAVNTVGLANSLKAGRFELTTGMNPDLVINALIAGPVVKVFRVTIPEGKRIPEIISILSQASGIPEEQFSQALRSGKVPTTFREMPANPTLVDWEGLLFPDTYEFSEKTTAADMLTRMSRTMEIRMDSIDWRAFEQAGFTKYDGIIIASMIEAEVQVAEERPIVSSVIRNRLKDNIALGIDATILFGMGIRDPAKIDVGFDSPYNTRIVAGLPPTPIAAPGLASLQAAAAPATTEFYYYVLKDLEGHHAFAKTLEEHNANVAKAKADGVLP